MEVFSVRLWCHQDGVCSLFSYYVRHHGVFRHFLLLLCGDVSLNPGPFKYPCTVCRKCVRSNQHALQFDRCQLWSHIACVRVGHDFYAELQDKSEFSWQCPSCLFSVLPSFDVCDDLQSVNNQCTDSHNDSKVTPDDMNDKDSILLVLKDNPSGLRIVHHNVQGLCSKSDELSLWFSNCVKTATIFCFTEVWLRPGSPDVTVPGYTVYTTPMLCCPSKASSYLPGSCLIISNDLAVERSPICEKLEQSCRLLNIVCCYVTCKHTRLFVMAVYRSPSTDVKEGLTELTSLFNEICFLSENIVVVGDFNIDLLTPTAIQAQYVDLLTDCSMVQHLSDPS